MSPPRFPDMPGEFVALGDLPIEPWTLRDSARSASTWLEPSPRATAASSRTRSTWRAIGPKNFDTLLPVHSPHPRITVPRADGKFPSQPGRTRRDERIGFRKSQRFLAHTDLSAATDTAAQIRSRRRPPAHRARG